MKTKFYKFILSIVIIFVMLTTSVLGVMAEGGTEDSAAEPLSIAVDSAVASGKTISIEGHLTEAAARLVSVLVLPEEIDGYSFDTLQKLLDYSDYDSIWQKAVYMYNTRASLDGKFEFKFIVADSGNFRVFLSANGAEGFEPVRVFVKGIVDSLNEQENYEDFGRILSRNIDETGSTLAEYYKLLNSEEKAAVDSAVFDLVPFSDKEALATQLDIAIQAALDALLSKIKSPDNTADELIDLIEKNEKIIGVTKLNIYLNTLNDEAREYVKSTVFGKRDEFLSIDNVKTIFDSAVVKSAEIMETSTADAFNSADNVAEFVDVLILNKELIGMNETQIKLFNRLSDNALENLASKMIVGADDNNDGKTDFNSYEEILAAYNEAVDEIGMTALVLDAVNYCDSATEIIDIFNDYPDIFNDINFDGFEKLKNGEDESYQQAVINVFLSEDYESIEVAVTELNRLIDEQASAKENLTKINSLGFSDVKSIIEKNHEILGINSDVYSDYLYISNKNSSKQTDIINMVIKHVPYYNIKDFSDKFAENVSDAMKNIDTESEDKPKRSGGGGGGITVNHPQSNEPVSEEMLFNDLDSVPWAKDKILYLAERNVLNGKGNGIFDPNGYVTREEFTKMLVAAFGIYVPDAVSEFTDSDSSQWYDSYIASAFNRGIAKGTGNGSFGVGQSITREDMTVLAYRALSTLNGFSYDIQNKQDFADHSEIADYAIEGVYSMRGQGYVNGTGDNMFSPKKWCTRAEAAVIIYNIIY